MKPLGGYLGLELRKGKEHYPHLIRLNTGRNALEYLLKVKPCRKIYIPYFTCEVILEPLKKLNIPYQYYTIDANMDPVMDFELQEEECLLYTNYFGLKQETVLKLSSQSDRLIVDNSQAFFCDPVAGTDTFYSCRKFFGVPDGAYLQAPGTARLKLRRDSSADRFSHLIKSIDQGIETGYMDYVENNNRLSGYPVRRMSALSRRILSSINYQSCKDRRNTNFQYLHEALKNNNEYEIDNSALNGPMIYPLLHPSAEIKGRLLAERIFVPTYWPNVLDWTDEGMFEHYLTTNLIALPVDHRYNLSDMKHILHVLNKLL